MENILSDLYKSLLSKMDDEQSEAFLQLLFDKGFEQFDATDKIWEFYEWAIKNQGQPLCFFSDPDDGMYLYACRYTVEEAINIMTECSKIVLKV